MRIYNGSKRPLSWTIDDTVEVRLEPREKLEFRFVEHAEMSWSPIQAGTYDDKDKSAGLEKEDEHWESRRGRLRHENAMQKTDRDWSGLLCDERC